MERNDDPTLDDGISAFWVDDDDDIITPAVPETSLVDEDIPLVDLSQCEPDTQLLDILTEESALEEMSASSENPFVTTGMVEEIKKDPRHYLETTMVPKALAELHTLLYTGKGDIQRKAANDVLNKSKEFCDKGTPNSSIVFQMPENFMKVVASGMQKLSESTIKDITS